MKISHWLPALVPALVLAGSLPALAQDPAPADPGTDEPEKLWETTVGLAYLANSGNSDNSSFGLDGRVARRPTPWGMEAIFSFNRAEEDDVKTAERYFGSLRGSRAFNERWAVFVGGIGEKDEFAGVDRRWSLEAGAIYNALLGPRHTLSFDFGPSWTDEDLLPPEPDVSFFGGVAGLDYKFAFTETAFFAQRLKYEANFDDSEDWRGYSLTSVTAALTSVLGVQLGYEIRYRNLQIGENETTDTTTKVSLVANF